MSIWESKCLHSWFSWAERAVLVLELGSVAWDSGFAVSVLALSLSLSLSEVEEGVSETWGCVCGAIVYAQTRVVCMRCFKMVILPRICRCGAWWGCLWFLGVGAVLRVCGAGAIRMLLSEGSMLVVWQNIPTLEGPCHGNVSNIGINQFI